ncbi:MAG: terminase family protein [Treponema sp.]|jgi:hypothetical protein|nr:terminase family protein [Treponema sp.]
MSKNIVKMTGFDQRIVNTVLWKPHEKQSLAIKSNAFELLFGGAAGGGKSDFLLIDYYAGVNKYAKAWTGILFRRSMPELEELKKRACEIYIPLGGRLTNNSRDFIFPNGATLKMRYLDNDKDVLNYQGHQYTWIGFDELGNYPTDYAWRYMITRARSAAGVPCYMRATANPGGVGHAWIKTRFIDGFSPYRKHQTIETNGMVKIPITRCFIPSMLEDNPTLMNNDPDYEHRLALLPGHLYRALRHGDWDIFAGQVFEEFRRSSHVIKPFALEPGQWKKFYSFDWGYAKPFSLGKWAVNSEGRMIRYGEWYGCDKDEMNVGIKMGTAEVADKAWKMAVLEGVTEVVADTAMWNKEDDAPSRAEQWEDAGFKMIKANKDRVNGKAMFHQRLQSKDEDGHPMLQIFDHCVDFIRTIPVLTPDPHKPEDVNTNLEDHIYDESRYAVMSDFAHNPGNALRKQHGSYNFRRKKTSADLDPIRMFKEGRYGG